MSPDGNPGIGPGGMLGGKPGIGTGGNCWAPAGGAP